MQNGKKLLSVMLALSMSASLVVTAPAAYAADLPGTTSGGAVDGVSTSDGLETSPSGGNDATLLEAAATSSLPFTDIADSWAKEYIVQGYGLGLFQGNGDGTFAPNSTLSRAELLQTLYSLEGSPAVSGTSKFTDVTGQWYTNAVLWGEQNGLAAGYEDGTFGADKPVTRQEMVTFLARYAQMLGVDVTGGSDLSGFPDSATVANWAKSAFAWAVSTGVVHGVENPDHSVTLTPSGNANRASFATLMVNFVEYLNQKLSTEVEVVSGSNGTLAANTEQQAATVTLSGQPGAKVKVVTLGETTSVIIPSSGQVTISAPEDTDEVHYQITLTDGSVEVPVEAGTILTDPTVTITEDILDYYVSHGQATARYERAAIYADETGISATKSVLAAVNGTATVSSNTLDDVEIISTGDYFGGVRVGGTANFSVSNTVIDLTGDGGDDFTGIGAALAVADEATLTVRNTTVNTQGIIRQGLFVGDDATLEIYDSTIICDPGEYVSDVSIPTAGMASPPAGLGVYGNCRALNLVDNGTIYLENCTITSKNWGVLGVDDVTDGHVTAVNCTITIEESGYGAYAIGQCVDEFKGCTINITNGTVAYAAAGDGSQVILSEGTVAKSDRYGLVTHQSFNGLNSTLVVKDEGTILSADQVGILVKGRGADIIIEDGAVVESKDGPIIRAMLNDDTGAGTMDGTEVVNVTISNTTLEGDIVQAMGAPYDTDEDTADAPAASTLEEGAPDGMTDDGPMGPGGGDDATGPSDMGGGMGMGGDGMGSSSAKTESVMNVTLTNAELTGQISSAECELTISDGNISHDNVDLVGSVDSTTYCDNEYATLNLTLEDGAVWNVTGNCYVDTLEIDDTSTVSAETPVIVFFKDSDTVTNGEVIGNVQFVSDYDEVIAIIHTNDVHGHLDVEPYVKGLADEMKDSGDYSLVLTVSAGDVYAGGEAVAASYNGEFIPAIMDQVYDVVAPGNNDYGLGGAAQQDLLLTSLFDHTITLCSNYRVKAQGIDMASYVAEYGDAWIGNEQFANLYSKITLNDDGSVNWSGLDLQQYTEGENPYQDTATFTTSEGTVVGLFGLSTSGGAASTMLDSVNSITAAQDSTDALRAAGASVVVGVGHTGWPDGDDTLTATSSNDTNSAQIALQTTGIDAFVDGHTHSIIGNGEGWMGGSQNTYVNQAASFGTKIGVMYLYVADGNVIAKDGEVLSDMSDITPDADVQALVDTAMAQVQEDLGKVISSTDYFLNGERQSANNDGGTVRGNETNLGDLMTDVIFNAISEEGYDVDFVMYPGYWLRASIEAGDITIENIESVFANPTVLEYVTYTAQDVVDAMNQSLSVIPGEGTSFLQVSGINLTYTLNDGKAQLDTVTVGDTLIYKDGAIQVGDDWTCSGVYTLTGGEIDNWTGSTDNWICTDKTEVQELVANYLQTHTEGVDYIIYPNTVAPAGRIVCVN